MINPIGFLKKNHQKKLTVQVWWYAAVFRVKIKFVPMKWLEKTFGIQNEDTELGDIEPAVRKRLRQISYHVNRVASHTPWESLCLVRALTAQRIMKKEGLESTMYLGVMLEDGKMEAHAWIRHKDFYVTGGDGSGYAVVAKFRA